MGSLSHSLTHEDCYSEDELGDVEVICEACSLTEDSQENCCISNPVTVSSPNGKSHSLCCKCFKVKAIQPPTTKEKVPLPRICSCGKVDSYLLLERVDRVKAACKTCQKIALVKLSEDKSFYELWSNGRCPICRANPVRVSFMRGDGYKCDNCGTSFKVSEKHQQERLSSAKATPDCLTILDDTQFLKEGDLILLRLEEGRDETPVLIITIEEDGISYLNPSGNECLRLKDDLPDLFRRVEFLPHARLSSSHVVENSMSVVRTKDKPAVNNIAVFLKTGEDVDLVPRLSSLKERDLRIRTGCPKCKCAFTRSSAQKIGDYMIHLLCSSCGHAYEVPDVPKQRELLSTKFGDYEKEEITNIGQLGDGDIISFPRGNLYSHYAVCKSVQHEEQSVTLIEFTLKNLRDGVGIFESTEPFSKIANNFVLRFLPLDCLPADHVRRRAEELMKRKHLQQSYRFFAYNCQHFALWCKADQPKSEDGKFYEAVYNWTYFSVNLSSLIFPVLKPVSFGIVAVDVFLKAFSPKKPPVRADETDASVSIPPAENQNSLGELVSALRRAGDSLVTDK